VPYGVPHAFRTEGIELPAGSRCSLLNQSHLAGGRIRSLSVVGIGQRKSFSRTRGIPNARFGHFKEQGVQFPGGIGFQGLKVMQFMGRELGTQHFFMMRGELAVGGAWGLHDHPIEEMFLPLSGEAEMEIEGERYPLQPGDAAWVGVGASHSCSQRGNVPFRWLETQAPQFPIQNAIRNYAHWINCGLVKG